MGKEAPGRNLALEMVRVTEAAALASARWLGRGCVGEGDKAALEAMRLSLNTLEVDGTMVLGRCNSADPALGRGERLGTGKGPEMDVAMVPVEGARLRAFGRPNAVAIAAMSPRGSLWDPGPCRYLHKLVLPPEAKGKVDIDEPVGVCLSRVAEALNKEVNDLVVFLLDRPRHENLLKVVRESGARIQLHPDGDVTGALMAVSPSSEVDLMIGTGGCVEGVLSAMAIRAWGGEILARLDPQSEEERKAALDAGYSLDAVLRTEDMVSSEDVFVSVTGISSGQFLRGVEFTGEGAQTHSVVMRGRTGTIRFIDSIHSIDRLMKFSAIDYD